MEAAVHTHNFGAKITSLTLTDWDWPRLVAFHCLILSSLAVYYIKYHLPSQGFYLVHFYTWFNYCFCEDCVSVLLSVEGLWLTFDSVEMISCVLPGSVFEDQMGLLLSFLFLFFFLSFHPSFFILLSCVKVFVGSKFSFHKKIDWKPTFFFEAVDLFVWFLSV